VSVGEKVEIIVDRNRKENRRTSGQVSWIASESEFTPKLIQTKEERVDLVYAFKVRVDNSDGRIKIGMPGEVRFSY
jgi:HlyD family secretion protein